MAMFSGPSRLEVTTSSQVRSKEITGRLSEASIVLAVMQPVRPVPAAPVSEGRKAKVNSTQRNRRARLMATLAGVVAGGALLALPSGASASTVDCWGGAGAAPDSKGLAYSYSFQCHSLEGDPTQVDAYSIISNRPVAEFGTEVVVSKDGVALNDQSFGCEGTFPSEGFGCFGKASLDNTIQGGFKLQRNPCTKKSRRKGSWHLWVVASANKINPITGAKTSTTTEPQRLRVPGCKAKSGK